MICQVEGDFRSRRVSVAGVDLEATQDYLLQPSGYPGIECPRRGRIAIEPLPQLGNRAWIAEWKAAGGELVEDGPECKEIAARIAAHAHHLLGRHVHPVADGRAEFLRETGGIVAGGCGAA